jgi:hypothetical protein
MARTADKTGTVPAAPDAETITKIAFDEAIRMLEAQGRRVESVRVRAGTIIGVAGIGATLLGSRGAGSSAASLYVSSGTVVVFAVAIALALWALMPRSLWYGADSGSILQNWRERSMTAPMVYEELADLVETQYDKNEKQLKGMVRRFQLSVIALLVGLGVLVGSMLLRL